MGEPLYFDDFQLGQSYTTATIAVSEEDIIRFANEFDPQYFHNDPERAKASRFGGLIASGLHSIAISMKLFFEMRLFEASNLSSPGIDEVRWKAPLRPGDRIHQQVTVEKLKPSASKPDRGVVWMRHQTVNQDGEVILDMLVMHLLVTRAHGPVS